MFPIFIDNEEIKIYDENIFFKKWDEIYKEQELINLFTDFEPEENIKIEEEFTFEIKEEPKIEEIFEVEESIEIVSMPEKEPEIIEKKPEVMEETMIEEKLEEEMITEEIMEEAVEEEEISDPSHRYVFKFQGDGRTLLNISFLNLFYKEKPT